MNRTTIYYALAMPSSGFLSGFDAVVFSAVNLIGRICLSMIDKIGRRHLMLIGLGYLLSLSMMDYGFFGQSLSVFNLFITIAFIVIHAIGKSTVNRLFILHIFPNNQRVKAQSFDPGIHWGLAAAITLFGKSMVNHIRPWKILSNSFIPYDFTAAFNALYHARDQEQITRICSEGIYNNLNSTYL